jgi:hypothetical protein
MKRAAVLVLAVGVLLLGGCGGDDDSSTDDSSTDGSDGSGGDDGGADASGDAGSSEATDLGGFGIPAPDGGTVILEMGDGGRSIDYPAADFDRIVQFYDEWVAGRPYAFLVVDGPDFKDYATDQLLTDKNQSITILRVDDITNVILGDDFEE